MITKKKIRLLVWTILMGVNLFAMEDRKNLHIKEYIPMHKGKIQCYLDLPPVEYNPNAENHQEIFINPEEPMEWEPNDPINIYPVINSRESLERALIIETIKQVKKKNDCQALGQIFKYLVSTIPQPSMEDEENLRRDMKHLQRGKVFCNLPDLPDFLNQFFKNYNNLQTEQDMKIKCGMIHQTRSFQIALANNPEKPRGDAFFGSNKYVFFAKTLPQEVIAQTKPYNKSPVPVISKEVINTIYYYPPRNN